MRVKDLIKIKSCLCSIDGRPYRGSMLRLDDVAPSSNPFDDTISMIEGLLVDTVPISHQGIYSRLR